MLSIILALIILYIIVGIIGWVVHGLIWLFFIALVLFILTLVFGALRIRR